MKKIFSLLLFFGGFYLQAYGQCGRIVFSYDNAGNRIKREYRTDCPPDPTDPVLFISPNPTSEKLTAIIDDRFIGGKLFVQDLYGKELFQQAIISSPVVLNVLSFVSGTYYLRVISGEKELTEQFLIVR